MVFIVAICMLFGCKQKDRNIEISGKIIEVNSDSDAILIEAESLGFNGIVWIDISKKTRFKSGADKEFSRGNYVEILLDGGLTGSNPMQARAKNIIVNE